jgi:predicted permease
MFDNLRQGLRAIFHRDQTERELDEELQDYLRQSVESRIESGSSPEEAHRSARVAFGSVAAVKEQTRDVGWESFVDSVWSDLRFAVRTMRRAPGFSAIVVATLALGIGANTALFTVINAALLKPLPVKDPGNLVLMVWDSENKRFPFAVGYDGSASSDFSTTGHQQGTSFPYITYERLSQQKDTFSDVFAFTAIEQLNVENDGGAEVASGQYVTGNYYDALGVRALRGRMLAPADDVAGAPPAAVITWKFWQRRFNGEAAVGKTIIINNVKFTIVGISPPEFNGALEIGQPVDVTVPISTDTLLEPANHNSGQHARWWLHTMARLQPHVTRTQAQARMDSVFQQSAIDGLNGAIAAHQTGDRKVASQDYPHLLLSAGAQGDEFSRRRYRRPLALLMGVVGLVLLIACINVANMLLARSSARQREFGMRLALGARRGRLIRQLLTECLLLSSIAGVLGLFLAAWGKDLLVAWSMWIQSDPIDAGLDRRVLIFAITASMLTGILFGIAPALRAGGDQLASAVKAQIGSAGRQRTWMARILIVAQVAISLVLLVGAGLFLRTVQNLHSVDAGFDRSNLLLFRVKPESNGYNFNTVDPLYERMIERLGSIPGVQGVALSRHPLLGFSHRSDGVYLVPGDVHNGENVEVNVVSPSFFDTMKMPILLGRSLQQSDAASALRVVVVNESFAKRYFPGANPIGRQLWLGKGGEGKGNPSRTELKGPPNDQVMEIVGISRDAKYTDLRSETSPTVFQPYAQKPTLQAMFEVRYRGNDPSIASTLRTAVREVDARLPIFDLRTQADLAENSLGEERMFANLSTCMAVLALVLVAVGLYGIMSYSVGRRTSEIGVRMALGAKQGTVLAMILRESLMLVSAGLLVGIPIAWATLRAASSILADVLFGIKPVDPFSFAVAIVVMSVVAIVAAYSPARRAARTDPISALRCD